MLAPTDLTVQQARRLLYLAKDEPLTKVIGWSHYVSGPIIRKVDDKEYYITPRGTVKLFKEYYVDGNGRVQRDDTDATKS